MLGAGSNGLVGRSTVTEDAVLAGQDVQLVEGGHAALITPDRGGRRGEKLVTLHEHKSVLHAPPSAGLSALLERLDTG
jgi:hypothetical protein